MGGARAAGATGRARRRVHRLTSQLVELDDPGFAAPQADVDENVDVPSHCDLPGHGLHWAAFLSSIAAHTMSEPVAKKAKTDAPHMTIDDIVDKAYEGKTQRPLSL